MPALLSFPPQAGPSFPASAGKRACSLQPFLGPELGEWGWGGALEVLCCNQAPREAKAAITKVPGRETPSFSTAPSLGGKLKQYHQAPALDFLIN